MATTNNTLASQVTERFIEALKQGHCPWAKPWRNGMDMTAVNYTTRKPYSLLNQILLGFQGGEFATLTSINKLGGKLNKGAKANWVIMSWVKYYDADGNECDKDDEGAKPVFYKRWTKVFNISDTTLPSKFAKVEALDQVKAIAQAEDTIADYVARSGVKYQCDKPSNEAFYRPSTDEVVVPMRNQFVSSEEYYSTAFHELGHSTAHPSRLAREIGGCFGSTDYAKEELVAELTAAFSLYKLGIETSASFKNSTAYIQNWLKVLENDDKLVLSACAYAEKALAYIFGETK